MAISRENIVAVDMSAGTIHRSFVNKAIGEGDALADRFGVQLTKEGEPVNLSSSECVGYFMRADGETIVINGHTSNDMAYVILPELCYAVEGNFTLVIKLTGGGVNGTVRIVDGTVVKTTTDEIIATGGSVPDVSALTELTERIEAAAEDIEGFSIEAVLNSGADYTLVVVND